MSRAVVLSVSHATDVEPLTQIARERGLLAAAALGESHIHVSTLAPRDVLALGAFHRSPAHRVDVTTWRRHVGGRAVACGAGFTLVSIALPHRAALVADDRLALAPDQVMNRCVRGLLEALRRLGVDLVYPGRDTLTLGRRIVATMGVVEVDGPTLFQVILATTSSFARSAAILDRADPEGVVPATLVTAAESCTLVDAGGVGLAEELTPPVLASHLATAHARVFGVRYERLDDDVTTEIADAYRDAPDVVDPPRAHGASARTLGLLGPVEAWTTSRDGRIVDFVMAGDFLAPARAPTALAEALRGLPTEREAVEATVAKFLDRDLGYFLGLRPTDLIDLVWRSVEIGRGHA